MELRVSPWMIFSTLAQVRLFGRLSLTRAPDVDICGNSWACVLGGVGPSLGLREDPQHFTAFWARLILEIYCPLVGGSWGVAPKGTAAASPLRQV